MIAHPNGRVVELPRACKLSHGPAGWSITVMNAEATCPAMERTAPTVYEVWKAACEYMGWVDQLEREVA